MPRALLSVSDKTGIVDLGRGLVTRGFELVSTGGTARALTGAGLPVTAVSTLTGFPEMMDGRVKTLHPALHAGILARRDRPDDLAALEQHGLGLTDVVVVNLYPFVQAAANPATPFDTLVEEIDIGGPALVRAAAKNFRSVLVVVRPADYPRLLSAIDEGPSLAFRFELMRTALAHTAAYDTEISATLATIALDGDRFERPAARRKPELGNRLDMSLEKIRDLRYGENPHQRAAWYRPYVVSGFSRTSDVAQDFSPAVSEVLVARDFTPAVSEALVAQDFSPAVSEVLVARDFTPAVSEALVAQDFSPAVSEVLVARDFTPALGGLGAATILQGRELSYTNLLDLDAAACLVLEFEEPAAVIVKHTNPCGAATGSSAADAYVRAREADPLAAFGGIVALNRAVDVPAAEAIVSTFIEAVIAPSIDEAARPVLAKKANMRLVTADFSAFEAGAIELRSVLGAMLAQERDTVAEARRPWSAELPEGLRVVTKRQPSVEEWEALRFAWRVGAHVKSNTVIFTDAKRTLAIGAGQMSRVDAVKVAVMKAKAADRSLAGSVAASDAFFPFRDGLDAVAAAGATAVVQPGGSIRDAEVIAAADEHGIAMVFTGRRHFRH